MKPIQLSIVLAVLATVAAPVLRSQDAPKPDASTPGLGTPIAVPEGFVSLDGKAYFIRNGQAVPIDAVIANRARDAGIASPETLASSLKPGTMMTLEGKVIAIPSGVVFSKSLEASAPVTDDRAADRAISSQNTTGLAPAPKNPNMLGQPGNISAPPPSSNGNAGAATGSGSSGRRNNNVAGGGSAAPLDGSVVVNGTPQTTGGNSTANPDGSVTTISPNGTATTVNPNGTTTTVTANGLTSTVPSNAGTSNSTPATNANGGAGVNGTTTTNANMTPANNNNGTVPSGNATNNGTVRSVDAVPNGTGINNPNNTGAPNGTSTNANGTSNNANGNTNNNAGGTNNKASGSSSSSGSSRASSSGTSKSGGGSSSGGTSGGAGGGGARAGGR